MAMSTVTALQHTTTLKPAAESTTSTSSASTAPAMIQQ
jgi:hypothetical protein